MINNELDKKLGLWKMENAKLAIWLTCVRHFSLSGAVFSVFFILDRGFSVADFAIFQTVVRLSQAALEIPSGIFADKFGRRRSVMISRVLVVAAFVLIAWGASLPMMLVAAILDGIAMALYSDSDTSLVYDSYKKLGRSKDYPKFIAVYNAMGMASFGVASVIGASLAAAGVPIVWLIVSRIPLFILQYFMAKGFREKVSKAAAPKASQTLRHLKATWGQVLKHRGLVKIIYFHSIILGANLVVWAFYQPYGLAINMSLAGFGWIALLFAVAEGFPQFIAYKYVRAGGFSKMYVILILLIGLLHVGAFFLQNMAGFVLLIISTFLAGFSFPLSAAIVQRYAKTEYRTTIMSLSTLFGIGTFSVAGLVFAMAADQWDVFAGFGVIGGGTVIGALIYIAVRWVRPYMHKHGVWLWLQHMHESMHEPAHDAHDSENEDEHKFASSKFRRGRF